MRHAHRRPEPGLEEGADYTAERQRRQDAEGPGTPEAVVALGEEILREQQAGRLGPLSPHSRVLRP